MPKRGENIYKRKDGRWEGRYIKERDEKGRAKYGSVYAKTYKEVRNKLFKARQDVIQGIKPKDEEQLFAEVLQLWMKTNHVRHKGATENKYQYLIDKHIIPELGKIPVSALTTLRINTFLEQKLKSGRLDKKGGLSPAYVRSMMLIINSAMQFAARENMCRPLNTPIHKPVIEKKDLQILSVEGQRRLENYLCYELNPTKLGILISLHTGMRIGEVCALKWEDIDFEERIIHVHSTIVRLQKGENEGTQLIIDSPKTKASLRDIPISTKLFPAVVEIKKTSKSEFVISNQKTFLNPRTYEYRYHKILSECIVEDINYHALRHTFATRCIEVGMDIKSLSEIMGHANVAITMNTYVHSSMELKRRQIEKLGILSA